MDNVRDALDAAVPAPPPLDLPALQRRADRLTRRRRAGTSALGIAVLVLLAGAGAAVVDMRQPDADTLQQAGPAAVTARPSDGRDALDAAEQLRRDIERLLPGASMPNGVTALGAEAPSFAPESSSSQGAAALVMKGRPDGLVRVLRRRLSPPPRLDIASSYTAEQVKVPPSDELLISETTEQGGFVVGRADATLRKVAIVAVQPDGWTATVLMDSPSTGIYMPLDDARRLARGLAQVG